MKFSEGWVNRIAIYAPEAQQVARSAGCALNQGQEGAPWMVAWHIVSNKR